MSSVSKPKFDEGLIKLDDLKNDVQNKTQEIITLISRMKDTGMKREKKNILNESVKKPLVFLIKLKTKERNEVDEALKVTTFQYLHFIHVSMNSISCITLTF